MNQSSFLLRPCLPALALAFGARLLAQGPDTDTSRLPGAGRADLRARPAALRPHAAGPVAEHLLRAGPAGAPESVVFDEPGDGRIWALGTTYKASFGADGFVYVPFLGSEAPRNYPVQFVLRSVRVGGRNLELATDRPAVRSDARVTFDRGPVREIYDLAARSIEQTFVVAGDLPGDVEVELTIVSDLGEDPAQEGLQFANHLGQVDYGTAYLVQGPEKSEIPATFAGRTLRLQVPAAQRGVGPVVIDPVITTTMLTPTLMASDIPEIAYDATTDRWAVVWVHVFSAADHDVVAELRTGAGDSIAGSFKVIDPTTMSHTWPRVANLNSADRFLVAMERFVPQNPVGQRYTVWGRTLDAAAPFGTSGLIQISPTSTAEQNSVDVGGDPGNGTVWTVVWTHGTDIHARQVDASGTPHPNTIPIESTTDYCINPQISLSNGNGLTPWPRWCVVYSKKVSETDWDIWGAVLDLDGTVSLRHRSITSGSTNDLHPSVSSPMIDASNRPGFLVSYERQTSPPETMVKLLDIYLNAFGPEANLTRRFGFSGAFSRVESDGSRFAATCQVNGNVQVATLAVVNNDFVLHETLQHIGTGAHPRLASKRTGGGGGTEYGIVYRNTNSPSRTFLAIYQGRAPAGGFTRRSTGCGLSINRSGRPFLGEVLNFTISDPGTDLVILLLGLPAPAAPLCANCSLGIDPARPLFFFSAPLSLPLPHDPIFVGLTLATQGFGIGSGTCPGPYRVSDTIDFTIQ